MGKSRPGDYLRQAGEEYGKSFDLGKGKDKKGKEYRGDTYRTPITIEEEIDVADDLKNRINDLRSLIPGRTIHSVQSDVPSGVEIYSLMYGSEIAPNPLDILIVDTLRRQIDQLQDEEDKDRLNKELKFITTELIRLFPYHLSSRVDDYGQNVGRVENKNIDISQDVERDFDEAIREINKTVFSDDIDSNRSIVDELLFRIDEVRERLERYKKDPTNYDLDYLGWQTEEDLVKVIFDALDMSRLKIQKRIGSESHTDLFTGELMRKIQSNLDRLRKAERKSVDPETQEKFKNKIASIEITGTSDTLVKELRELYIEADTQLAWLEQNKNSGDVDVSVRIYKRIEEILSDVYEKTKNIKSPRILQILLDNAINLSIRLFSIRKSNSNLSEQIKNYAAYGSHYKVLGLSVGASPKEVRDTYKKLVKKLHTDKNPDQSKDQYEEFLRVIDAYETLKKASLSD